MYRGARVEAMDCFAHEEFGIWECVSESYRGAQKPSFCLSKPMAWLSLRRTGCSVFDSARGEARNISRIGRRIRLLQQLCTLPPKHYKKDFKVEPFRGCSIESFSRMQWSCQWLPQPAAIVPKLCGESNPGILGLRRSPDLVGPKMV